MQLKFDRHQLRADKTSQRVYECSELKNFTIMWLMI